MLTGCVSDNISEISIRSDEEAISVAATIFPLYDIVKNVAGDSVGVKLILPPGASPHTFDFTPSDLKKLQGVKRIFAIGQGVDSWSLQLADSIPGAQITELDEDIALCEFEEHHDEDEHNEGEDHHGEYDPHYWLDPENAIIMANSIAVELGKLVKIMIGIIKPTSGSVTIANKPPCDIRASIGYVPQRFDFNSKIPITVGEFMKLSLHIAGRYEREKEDIIKKRFKDVGLPDVMDKKLYELSGGQLQRVLIARAILTDKTLLILDEPVAGVDIEGRKSIYELLKDLNTKYSMTILLISHELDVVFNYSDQVICINRRMLCTGKPQKALTQDILDEMFSGKHHAHYHHECIHNTK